MNTTAPPTAIKRPAFWVLLAPDGADPDTVTDAECDTVHVVVNSQDQLRAELEAGQLGLRKVNDTPFHLTVLWLWAAMVRTKQVDCKWPEFKRRCLHYEPDKERPAPHTAKGDETDELDAHPTEASTSLG